VSGSEMPASVRLLSLLASGIARRRVGERLLPWMRRP